MLSAIKLTDMIQSMILNNHSAPGQLIEDESQLSRMEAKPRVRNYCIAGKMFSLGEVVAVLRTESTGPGDGLCMGLEEICVQDVPQSHIQPRSLYKLF